MTANVSAADLDRQLAAELFRSGLTPATSAVIWSDALDRSRLQVTAALAATNDLSDIAGGLAASGAHSEVLRALMAPPVSQDRFAILCPEYSKSSEKSGKALPGPKADKIAAAFLSWADLGRLKSLQTGADATAKTVGIEVTAAILAQRLVATGARVASSGVQEQDVRDALLVAGWTEVPRKSIQRSGDLRPREFMHNVLMANAGGLEQEVDVACGLNRDRILALECKVSNDPTNSIKRANDVLNKATAWQAHWGNFVVTGALLQGVFAANDVKKLADRKVVVFWNHRLAGLLEWLREESN